jgi:LPS export ABC transporter permease LptG
MALIGLIRLAQRGQLPAAIAVWTPNAIYALAGMILLARLERPGDRDVLARVAGRLGWWWSRMRARWTRGNGEARRRIMIPRLRLLPGVIDTYVLTSFLFYFAVVLASFVMMAHAFIFFELLGDVMSRGITAEEVMTYHFFLTPKLIYDSAPWSVVVAVLVTFALLSKSNEVTAMKACGVSLYRLAAPVLAASAVISGGLFAFDHYYIPEANRIQDGILNEIKGRPAQRYLSGNWIVGADSKLYYYKYFDESRDLMLGVNVWELEPETFALRRHISAESARWEPSLDEWIFQNGWAREIDDVSVAKYATFGATTFPELSEPPSYFLKEVKQEQQLNFVELRDHIRDLQQSGFDTVRLRVQYYKKFSAPVFVLIVALLAVPFSFLSGTRGAIASIGASGFGIAIAYWASSRVFEGIGNLAQLPPELAAWAPDGIFTLAGLYLFTRMRS